MKLQQLPPLHFRGALSRERDRAPTPGTIAPSRHHCCLPAGTRGSNNPRSPTHTALTVPGGPAHRHAQLQQFPGILPTGTHSSNSSRGFCPPGLPHFDHRYSASHPGSNNPKPRTEFLRIASSPFGARILPASASKYRTEPSGSRTTRPAGGCRDGKRRAGHGGAKRGSLR